MWTDPDGQTHLTRPGSYGLFPQLCRPTAPVVLSAAQRAAAAAIRAQPAHGLAMPRRRRTRDQNRAQRINAERHYNENYCVERRLSAMLGPIRDKPPPF